MNTNSRWTEIKLRVPTGWQELVADSLGQAVCTTVQIGDHDPLAAPAPPGSTYVRTYIPTSQDSPAWRSALQTTLQDLATRVGVEELGAIEATYTILPQEDYANSWKKSWKAFRLRRPNGSLRVEPPWSALPDRDGETRLILEPGGAFGSGRHATTRTCLGVVLERLRGEERVLDAGSGSGILAVTSVLLGAAQATGFDVDAVATQSAQELAATNQVTDRTHFFTGGMESIPSTSFDIVFANIYSDVIVEHAHRLAGALAPQGWFAFSGCPSHHRDKTRDAILGAGLSIDEERRRGRWCTFVGTHAGQD